MSELLAKSDIVQLVSEYVYLSPKGGRMWGLCPFHGEKTASFSVSPDKQLYYCFGCHSGGGIIQFVMEIEKLSYSEAVEFLARRCGMELPNEINDEKLKRDRAYRERLYSVCKEAALFYHDSLIGNLGAEARIYVSDRGINAKTVRRFGIGYAPKGWNNIKNYLNAKGFTDKELLDAGLIIAKGGNYYDAYRGRIIFPIIAANGRVVAFGARTMNPEDTPKYINTGDTSIYKKRQNLYALNFIKGSSFSDIIMVEGYLDVISLHQCGIHNAVASLGTALTEHQAKLLKRYVSKVYIAYDGDAAGQNAALRGMEILAAEGLEVRVIELPGGMDPDDYVRTNGMEAFLRLKESAGDLNTFKLSHMASAFDLTTEDGRIAYAKAACSFIGKLEPVDQEKHIKRLESSTGIPMESLKAQCNLHENPKKNNPGRKRNNRDEKVAKELTEHERTEKTLLACMLAGKDAFYGIQRNPFYSKFNIFDSGSYAKCTHMLGEAYSISCEPDVKKLISSMDAADAELVIMAYEERSAISDPLITGMQCLKRLALRELESKAYETAQALKAQKDPEGRAELKTKLQELFRYINDIKKP